MINVVLREIGLFFLIALSAMTIQNSVLARALGVSRLISLVDETTDTIIFGILLAVINVLSGILYYFVNTLWLRQQPFAPLARPLVMILCMSVVFFLIFVLTVKFIQFNYLTKAVAALPPATFNCTVIGTLLISTTSQFSLASTVAFGLGTSVGFVLVVLLVTEGQRRIQGRATPAAFKGLPATLLFLAGLAMAVYGLSGHSYSF